MFKDFKTLLSDLIAYVGAKGLTDFNVGSIVRTLLEGAAAMMEECYYLISVLLSRFWIRTATGEWLDRRAEDFGKTRKPGSCAEGLVIIGRDSPAPFSISIPAGTTFEIDGFGFITLDPAVIRIGETQTGAYVRAQQIGSVSKYVEDTVLHQVGIAISGIEWAKVKKLEGGADIESDDDFRTRLLNWLRNPGTSGNIADYKNWCMDIEGVTGVRVLPTWDGPGTVKLVILGPDRKTPGVELVQVVQDTIAPEDEYSETRLAPIGATVTVVGAKAVEVAVEATILQDTEKPVALEVIKENFIYALQMYLAEMALKTTMVRYNRIGALLASQDGVLDYLECTINGEEKNLPVTDENVAVVGTVTLHVGTN